MTGPHPRAATMPRRDIQGLRAVAVGSVLVNHVTGWPVGGFVGVDIFFVISGFLITGLLVRELERTGRISFRRFYERRVKRILPAALVVLALTWLASWVLLPHSRFVETSWDAVWALLFAGNWRFGTAGTDYFNEGLIPSPLQHFWSLAVEEQFYFVWPVVMLLAWLWSLRWGPREGARNGLAVTMGVVVGVSLAWSWRDSAVDPAWAYFSTFTRVWELGAGALLAILAGSLHRLPVRVRPVLAWAGLAAMTASFLLVTGESGFPVPAAVLPVAGALAVIAAGTGGRYAGPAPLTSAPLRGLGDISYSLYLWHWPLVILMQAFLPRSSVAFLMLTPMLSLAAAAASYRWLEQPLRHASWFRSADPSVRPLFGGRSLIGVGAALTVLALVGAGTRAGLQTGEAPVSSVSAAILTTCLGAGSVDHPKRCASALTGPVRPSVDAYATDTGGAYQCWRRRDEPLRSCLRGVSTGKLRVALIGDSHAAALLPALLPVARSLGWRLEVHTGFGCQWMRSDHSNCRREIADLQQRLESQRPYDVILTTAARTMLGRDTPGAAQRFADYWRPVSATGTRVVVIADVPAVNAEALACLNRVGFDPSRSACGTPRSEALSTPDALLKAAAASDARVVDLTRYFCDDRFCPSVVGHAIVYRDTVGHTTATFERTLIPRLTAALGDAVG